MSLERWYGNARLEAASTRALATGAVSYRSVKSILATGLDQLPPESPADPPLRLPTTHAHVRGPEYYRTTPAVADALELPFRHSFIPGDAPVLIEQTLTLLHSLTA